MRGFRPSYYPENPKLTSLEILHWAKEKVDAFTVRDCFVEFKEDLNGDLRGFDLDNLPTLDDAQRKIVLDAIHDLGERLRKLEKSSMITVASIGVLKQLVTNKQMSGTVAAKIERRLAEIGQSGGAGRKPRLYFLSQAGIKYVETRKDEVEALNRKKKRR